jgi:hypothetical protein
MKKSKLFIATGTLLLAVTAMFATKANKKFTAINTAYFKDGSDYFINWTSNSVLTTNSSDNANQLVLHILTQPSKGNIVSGDLFTAVGGTPTAHGVKVVKN